MLNVRGTGLVFLIMFVISSSLRKHIKDNRCMKAIVLRENFQGLLLCSFTSVIVWYHNLSSAIDSSLLSINTRKTFKPKRKRSATKRTSRDESDDDEDDIQHTTTYAIAIKKGQEAKRKKRIKNILASTGRDLSFSIDEGDYYDIKLSKKKRGTKGFSFEVMRTTVMTIQTMTRRERQRSNCAQDHV